MTIYTKSMIPSSRHTRLDGRTKPGALLKHQIPIRTDHWDVTPPGCVELDLVSHSGNAAGNRRLNISLPFSS